MVSHFLKVVTLLFQSTCLDMIQSSGMNLKSLIQIGMFVMFCTRQYNIVYRTCVPRCATVYRFKFNFMQTQAIKLLNDCIEPCI